MHRTARTIGVTVVTALSLGTWTVPLAASAAGTAAASASTATSASASASVSSKDYSSRTTDAQAAAGYLVRRLVGRHHDHLEESYVQAGKTVRYPAYGEDADTVLSLDAAGTAQAAARRVTSYLENHVTGYVGTAPSYSPGALGKLLLVAAAQHVNAHSFGGHNLVTELTGTEGAGGAARGEFQQGSFASTTSQALAVLGLADTPNAVGEPDAAAVSYLAGLQCPDGGFASQILADTAASCAAGEDVDSTGYAAQALLATQSKTAAGKALTFLTRGMHANGGLGSGGGNANSTSIAVEALVAAHKGVAKPVSWLRKHQEGCTAPASRRGGVRFQTSYDTSAQLATSQAGVALAHMSLAEADRSGAHAATPALGCPKK